jgi:hypothetical protein
MHCVYYVSIPQASLRSFVSIAIERDSAEATPVHNEHGSSTSQCFYLCTCFLFYLFLIYVCIAHHTGEDRGGAAGFDGRKEVVGCMRGFILVASVDARSQRTAVNVYDLRNKFVAFHLLLQAGVSVTAVACRGADSSSSGSSGSSSSSGNCAYVVTSQGTLMLLKERCAPFFVTFFATFFAYIQGSTVRMCTMRPCISVQFKVVLTFASKMLSVLFMIISRHASLCGSMHMFAYLLQSFATLHYLLLCVCVHIMHRDTAAKLELLYRKNLYPVAISLAYASDYDVGAIMDIYRYATPFHTVSTTTFALVLLKAEHSAV